MRKIIISGYYGFNNIGDDAMVEAFSRYFKEKRFDITVMSKNPEKTKKQFGVNAIDRSNIFKIISEIKKSDILISGGGTLLQDVTKVISIWYYLAVILIGIILKKKVYILFQGIGPINNKFNIWLTRKILKKVDYIVLRDNNAYEEMVRLNFDTSKTIVVSDLIFLLSVPDEKVNKELIRKYIVDYSEKKKYIGVSVRSWKEISNENMFAKMFDDIAIKYNAEIVFLPFHRGQDYGYSNEIIKKMTTKCHLVYDDFIPSQMVGIMSLMSANIGVRLHSLIFSILAKTPIVGITYDPKIDGFLKDIGMSPVCSYFNIDSDKVINEIGNILNGNFDTSVFDNANNNKEKILETLDKVMGEKYE